MTSLSRFDGWVPFRLYWDGPEPGVEWCYLGSKRFTEPFFETTIQLEMQTPFNSLFRFRTRLDDLEDLKPGLAPAGFIFHLSRCGSTLITQLFASQPENVVLSEPGLLAALMRRLTRRAAIPIEVRLRWIRGLVTALGQRRTGIERQLFIKFDPVSILDFPLLRLAYPDVPWIFVYRAPVEVMVSNLRAQSPMTTRGMLGGDCLPFNPADVATMDDDEYAARVLGVIAETALQFASDPRLMLVNYSQLPELTWTGIARHFGIAFTGDQLPALKQIAGYHAKKPAEGFSSDSEDKNREATPRVRQAAARWILPHYLTLETHRLAPSAAEPVR